MTAVTLDEVKEYLRYDADDDAQDTALAIILAGAQDWVERHTGQVLEEREVTQSVTAFTDFITLNQYPFVSDLVITYRDTAGDEQTIDDATVVNVGGVYRAYPASAWPSALPGVTLTYTAGYADPNDAPAALLQAMCLIAGMNDEERAGGDWKTVEWLLESFRKPALR